MRRNTPESWGSVSITLHWTIALLILLVQVPAGITMVALGPGTLQNVLYNVHKNTGLVIFALAVIRLGWRSTQPVPALPADLPQWQATAARVTHGLLYLLLFLMPITGFLYTALGGFPVPLFMLYDLARLVPENKPLAEVFKYAHLSLQFVLYAVVVLHVAGALQHHLMRRDGVLRRMLSSTAPLQESRPGSV
jgi:cytochrome b561